MVSTNGALPIESDSQRIGRLAKKCFDANSPISWMPQSLEGTDFGFDIQIQVSTDGKVSEVFRLQLKGTTSPTINATGEYFSIELKISTFRYLTRGAEPVLLVLADLSVDPNHPKNCPLYYVWMPDEARRLAEREFPEDQTTVTLRIPRGNSLSDSTDLSDDYTRFRQLANVGNAIDYVAERSDPALHPLDRANLVSKIPNVLERSSPALLEALAVDEPPSWPEAPTGSFAWHLHEIDQALRIGDDTDASRILLDAEPMTNEANGAELAEYWFLVGRRNQIRHDEQGAIDAFDNAATISGEQPKYVAAWAESALRARYESQENPVVEDLLERVSGEDSKSMEIRARLQSVARDFSSANETAGNIAGVRGYAARVMVLTMQGAYSEVVDQCDEGLSESNINNSNKQLFSIFKARALFYLSLAPSVNNAEDGFITYSGPTGLDIGLLHRCWGEIRTSVALLRADGWPLNIEVIADIWAAAASILGKESEAFPLLLAAANKRENYPALQRALESLATHCGEYEEALKANARLSGEDVRLRKVQLLHLSSKHANCVRSFEEMVHHVDADCDLFGVAAGMAIISAHKVVRTDLVAEWTEMLASYSRFEDEYTRVTYALEKSENSLSSNDALDKLRQVYKQNNSLSLAAVLLHELDASDDEQANECVEVAGRIQQDVMLPEDARIHLAQALVTLQRWDELLAFCQSSIDQFPDNARFVAVKAIALDRMGFSADALDELRQLMSVGSRDSVALNTYANIVVRCGFTDDAIAAVEEILSGETDSQERIELLQMLFNLTQLSDPFTPRSFEIAWRLGQEVDQNDERQEALFLTLTLVATAHCQIEGEDSKLEEINQRQDRFFDAFPDATALRRAQLPANANADEVEKILRHASGVSEERLVRRRNVERLLERGEISIPYSWRPQKVLPVSDLPTLWEIGKKSKSDQRQFHLTMTDGNWDRNDLARSNDQVPLLDMVTLLVVHDLDVFHHLFSIFPKVAIGQATLVQLMNLCSPMSGCMVQGRCVDIRKMLQSNLARILQPCRQPPEGITPFDVIWPSDEVKEIARSGEYTLYTDDAVFRQACELPDERQKPICTLDVLRELQRKGVMSIADVAKKISKLASWRVGLIIDFEYQIAVLPDNLSQVSSVAQGIDVLRSSEDCIAIFDAIWNPKWPYESFERHGAAILEKLAVDTESRIESIGALMGLWFGKAKLREDAPSPVMRILVHLVLAAVMRLKTESEDVIRRIWTVYRSLVELHFGDEMDERKEQQSLSLMGAGAAELEIKSSLGVDAVRRKLALGLTRGTADAESFNSGYQARYYRDATAYNERSH